MSQPRDQLSIYEPRTWKGDFGSAKGATKQNIHNKTIDTFINCSLCIFFTENGLTLEDWLLQLIFDP